jgi:RNA polymerase sigma factor (sigma-70 family)
VSLSIEEKLEFLLKYAKLQGFAGISQIKEVAETPAQEDILIKKLQENNVEINYFLRATFHNYKTASYSAKRENRFTLTTRIDEKGDSFLLNTDDEKELFEKMSAARNNILKYAFENDEIRDFIIKLANKIAAGTIKISAVVNCEKNKSEEMLNNLKNNFIDIIKKLETADRNRIVELLFSLDFNEKTKGMILNKFTKTIGYNNTYSTELYKWEQIYSASKREIIEANIRLVFSIAKEYSVVHKGILDITDIIQEGNIGLIDAVESFDYTKGNKFSSWAVWYIRRQIWTVVNSFKKIVYVPPKASTELYKISLFEEKYKLKKGENPSVSEIAEELGLKEKQVVSLLSSDFGSMTPNYELSATDGDYYEDIEEFDEKTNDPFNILAASGFKENIDVLLAQIGERERNMVKLYFGLIEDKERMNLVQIGTLYGLSRERVRQIIERALENIKETQPELISEWR